MTTRYGCRFTASTGLSSDVLVDRDMSFVDEDGAVVSVINSPDQDPPVGEVPFLDEGGDEFTVAYSLVDVSGPFESAYFGVQSNLVEILEGLGLSTQTSNERRFETTSVSIDLGDSFHVGIGRFRIVGTARVELRSTLDTGEPLRASSQRLVDLVSRLHATLSRGDLRFQVASSMAGRREDDAWSFVVTAPWTFDFDASVPTPETSGLSLTLPQQVRATVATRSFSSPIYYDNQGASATPTSLWMSHSVLLSERQAIGPRRARRGGISRLTINATLNAGMQEALALVDQVADSFRGLCRDDVRFQVPRAYSGGRDSNWWTVIVDCPFFSDEV